jgi:hypothetical protein
MAKAGRKPLKPEQKRVRSVQIKLNAREGSALDWLAQIAAFGEGGSGHAPPDSAVLRSLLADSPRWRAALGRFPE